MAQAWGLPRLGRARLEKQLVLRTGHNYRMRMGLQVEESTLP